jgi:hypothetical protein
MGLLLLSLMSGAAFAQGEEFSMPAFSTAADAGLPVPTAPPLPVVEPRPGPPRPPPPPTWSRIGGSTSLLFAGLRDYYLGAELSLLATLAGTPEHSPSVPGEVEGFLFQLGAQGGYGRGGGPLCLGSPPCATRVTFGLAVKGGWARGLPHIGDGVARAQTMYFGQLDVLAGHYEIESAPLSPGVRTWELIARLRLGLHFTSDASRATFTGVTLFLAALIEVIPVSSATRGVSIGACGGIGF